MHILQHCIRRVLVAPTVARISWGISSFKPPILHLTIKISLHMYTRQALLYVCMTSTSTLQRKKRSKRSSFLRDEAVALSHVLFMYVRSRVYRITFSHVYRSINAETLFHYSKLTSCSGDLSSRTSPVAFKSSHSCISWCSLPAIVFHSFQRSTSCHFFLLFRFLETCVNFASFDPANVGQSINRKNWAVQSLKESMKLRPNWNLHRDFFSGVLSDFPDH